METRLVSADSHVMEPPDLWLKAIGHRFGDRTPQVRQLPGSARPLVCHRPELRPTRWRMASASARAARS